MTWGLLEAEDPEVDPGLRRALGLVAGPLPLILLCGGSDATIKKTPNSVIQNVSKMVDNQFDLLQIPDPFYKAH
jgi:hypothetical protein